MFLTFGGEELVAVEPVEVVPEDLADGTELGVARLLVGYHEDVGYLVVAYSWFLHGVGGLAEQLWVQEAMAFRVPLLSAG